jgi:hypothetical protein
MCMARSIKIGNFSVVFLNQECKDDTKQLNSGAYCAMWIPVFYVVPPLLCWRDYGDVTDCTVEERYANLLAVGKPLRQQPKEDRRNRRTLLSRTLVKCDL